MLIIWAAVIGVFLFFALVIVTLLLGASARRSGKEAQTRTEAQRAAGLTGDFTSDTPHSIHRGYAEA
jgi:UPF0716 family protein affecting phage T7 exclusion